MYNMTKHLRFDRDRWKGLKGNVYEIWNLKFFLSFLHWSDSLYLGDKEKYMFWMAKFYHTGNIWAQLGQAAIVYNFWDQDQDLYFFCAKQRTLEQNHISEKFKFFIQKNAFLTIFQAFSMNTSRFEKNMMKTKDFTRKASFLRRFPYIYRKNTKINLINIDAKRIKFYQYIPSEYNTWCEPIIGRQKSLHIFAFERSSFKVAFRQKNEPRSLSIEFSNPLW